MNVEDQIEGDADVVIYSAASSEQAHLLKFALVERGIAAEVINDALQFAVGSVPFGYGTSPRVIVRAKDAQQARQLALEFERDLRNRLLGASGERHWFQYSIYGLLILITCLAVYFGVTRASANLPGTLSALLPVAAIWVLFGVAMWRAYRRRKLEQSQWDDADDER
jgi:hypothetical protein